MANSGGLWDDSALIDAFDNAMSKYKKMHKKKQAESSEGAGDDFVGSSEDNTANGTDKSDGVIREIGENHSKTETAEIEEQPVQDTCGAISGSSNLRGIEDYNKLLGQYYELEAKRLKIWEQLQQFGYYTGETANLGTLEETSSAPQDYPTTAGQACYQNVGCSHCNFACPYPASLCTAYSGCCACFDPNVTGKLPSMSDDIVKIGMGAAEKAISSLRIDSSTNLNVDGENAKSEENKQQTATAPSSKTDLAAVLNAWYSAGFYTGKYLTEQSLAKKTNG